MKTEKKIALVTGVAGGIGVSIAQKLKSSNIIVFGIDCKVPNNLEYFDEFYLLDLEEFVNNFKIRENFFIYFTKWLGSNNLDLLVNNAAIQCLGDVRSLNFDIWNKSINVNLLAPFFLIQGLTNKLIQSNGCVINISSIHAKATKPNFVAYATSKAALSGMNRALSVELGSSISFFCIEPAAVFTEMLKEGFKSAPEKLNKLAICHPSGEISTPEQLADFIFFLFDKRIPALQGSAIEFGGGISGRLHDPE